MADKARTLFYWLVGLLLVFASFMKIHGGVATGIVDSKQLFLAKMLFCYFEFLFGIWLLLKYDKRSIQNWVLFFAFLSFGIYQLKLHSERELSCGCFGSFHLPPILVAMVDFMIVGIAFSMRRTRTGTLPAGLRQQWPTNRDSSQNWGIVAASIVWTFFSLNSIGNMGVPVALSSVRGLQTAIQSGKGAIVLKPIIRVDESIVGTKLDLESILDHREAIEALEHGKWLVSFVRPDKLFEEAI